MKLPVIKVKTRIPYEPGGIEGTVQAQLETESGMNPGEKE